MDRIVYKEPDIFFVLKSIYIRGGASSLKIMTLKDIAITYFDALDHTTIRRPIDSSHGPDDIRLAYVIDEKYVLHCYSSGTLTEKDLQAIRRLVLRHREIGVWAPMPISVKNSDRLLTCVEEEGVSYSCYLEEFAPFAFFDEANANLYAMKAEVLPFLGRLASRYTNTDLVDRYSMWSIVDRSPFDDEVDEKQENIDALCAALGDHPLAARIRDLNQRARARIQKRLEELPRCVFQGDLNPSNLLVDSEGRFCGIIDFNLFGTDVNINCFLNEAMYFLTGEDFSELSSIQLLRKLCTIQNDLLAKILTEYTLAEVEESLLEEYRFLVLIGFYPNVQLLVRELQKVSGREKVCDLITLICDAYEQNASPA